MSKIIRRFLLAVCVASALMAVSALAAGESFNDIAVEAAYADSVTAVADGEALKVSYSGAQNGKFYLISVLSDDSGKMDSSNTAYIYQVTAADSNVSFDVKSALFKPGPYYVYLSSNASSGIGKKALVATFTYGSANTTESYVERAYSVILGREGDAEGVAHWVSELTGGASAGEIIKEFFRSGEYQARGLSDAETVKLCYQAMLSREPSAEEVAQYVALLEDGYSTDKLVSSFVESPEFASICESYGLTAGNITLGPRDQNGNISRFVNRCYLYALERGADEGGLNEWCGHLINHDLNPEGDVYTPERVAFGFIFSGESQDKARDDTQYIEMLYHMMLDREPDAGVSNWVASLQSLTEAEVNWANASGERSADEARDLARQKIYAEFAASEEFGLMLNNFGL